MIGNRIRAIREEKKLCQIDLAVRAGLLQGFLSKVEGGEAVPDLAALDRIAAALDVPLHKLFYDGDEAPALPNLANRRTTADVVDGGTRKDRK
jgi:transcriptional regulator with XRE-family HTH domain